MIKLTPLQQADLIDELRDFLEPVPGGWGQRGATRVHLDRATPDRLRPAMQLAYRNLAEEPSRRSRKGRA